jgi:hypothetical protein
VTLDGRDEDGIFSGDRDGNVLLMGKALGRREDAAQEGLSGFAVEFSLDDLDGLVLVLKELGQEQSLLQRIPAPAPLDTLGGF